MVILFITGWSFECLRGWTDYLSLALPGLGMLLFEWSIFEIGVIGSGYLGKIDISVMSIGIQTIYILFMVRNRMDYGFKTLSQTLN